MSAKGLPFSEKCHYVATIAFYHLVALWNNKPGIRSLVPQYCFQGRNTCWDHLCITSLVGFLTVKQIGRINSFLKRAFKCGYFVLIFKNRSNMKQIFATLLVIVLTS